MIRIGILTLVCLQEYQETHVLFIAEIIHTKRIHMATWTVSNRFASPGRGKVANPKKGNLNALVMLC